MQKSKITDIILKISKQIWIILLLGMIYLFIFLKLGIGIPCLFRLITGFMCPGCGMTHAAAEIWKGNLKGAFEYNALSLTVLPMICIYLIYRFLRTELKKDERFRLWEYIFLILMLVISIGYAFIRNITGG